MGLEGLETQNILHHFRRNLSPPLGLLEEALQTLGSDACNRGQPRTAVPASLHNGDEPE